MTMPGADSTAFPVAQSFRVTRDGHKYFQCADNGPHERAGQWAIADNSGMVPWTTDDGVLWIKQDQAIVLGSQRIALALESPKGDTRTMISPADAVVVAVKLGLALKVADEEYRVVPVSDAAEHLFTVLWEAPDGTEHVHKYRGSFIWGNGLLRVFGVPLHTHRNEPREALYPRERVLRVMVPQNQS